MHTTLDIDYGTLAPAKELARRERNSAGSVLSRLALQPLVDEGTAAAKGAPRRRGAVSGFVPFDSRGVMVSNDDVNALSEAEDI